MKKLLLAISTIAAFTGSAFAADMAVKAPPMVAPPPPPPTFTGCWLSGGVGYGLFDQETTAFDTFGHQEGVVGLQLTDTYSNGGRGWLGRVGGGCDYQFSFLGNQQWVIGALADYDWTNIHGQFSDRFESGVGNENMNNQWAIGGRIGWVALPGLLTFVSAGYTQAHFQGVTFTSDLLGEIGHPTGFAMNGATYNGWFLGGGEEYAFTSFGLPNLFWKTEYRVSEFNSKDVLEAFVTEPEDNFSYRNKKWVQTVTTSLVWRFNWLGGAPVAARY